MRVGDIHVASGCGDRLGDLGKIISQLEDVMVSQEIRTNAIALGALMHQVDPEQAAVLRLIKSNLIAAADTAEELERSLVVPKPEPEQKAGKEIDEVKLQGIKRGLLISLATLVQQDCSGECEGCSHAKEVAHGQN
jgi:hypothetical protein